MSSSSGLTGKLFSVDSELPATNSCCGRTSSLEDSFCPLALLALFVSSDVTGWLAGDISGLPNTISQRGIASSLGSRCFPRALSSFSGPLEVSGFGVVSCSQSWTSMAKSEEVRPDSPLPVCFTRHLGCFQLLQK